jgi:hypothetical protein
MPTLSVYLADREYGRLIEWAASKGESGSIIAQRWLNQILSKDDLASKKVVL